jgi:membrane protease YdiL (CAAX protease family)
MVLNPVAEVGRFLRAALLQPVPAVETAPDEDHGPHSGGLRRRRVVAALAILTGGMGLALTLRVAPGDPLFLPLGFGLAVVWTVGAIASGPLPLGSGRTRAGGRSRPVVQSLALAVLLLSLFVLGAIVVARVPVLRDPVLMLLEHRRVGPLPLVIALTMVNGVAEELFFRGALFAAFPADRAVAATTALYTLTTVPSGVPLLVLAALLLGLVTALQRRVTGGVLGPAITHVIWSTAMLLLLPPLLNLAR